MSPTFLRSVLLCGLWFAMALTGRADEVADDIIDDNIFGLPDGAIQQHGALVVGGGGVLPDAIYEEFVKLAGGSAARIVLVPSAYEFEDLSHIHRAFDGWKVYQVESFDFLHTDDLDEATSEEFLKPLTLATGVWFSGGAQVRLIERFGGARATALLRQVVARGGVVGGTSAGASALSFNMIRNGSYNEAVMDRGLGLTTRLVIDQHFSQRGRFPRLLGVLEDHPGHIGLGVDEETAAIIEGNRVRVLGDGRATIFIGPNHAGEATAVHRLRAEETAEAMVIHREDGRTSVTVKKKQ
jgi:cyanophycinase